MGSRRTDGSGVFRIAGGTRRSRTGARYRLGDPVEDRTAAIARCPGGEPGLSSPDSLGIYLTQAPRRGRSDAERNCISNVRTEGLGYAAAAFKLAWLMRQAARLGATGVALKDDSDAEWAIAQGQGPAARLERDSGP